MALDATDLSKMTAALVAHTLLKLRDKGVLTESDLEDLKMAVWANAPAGKQADLRSFMDAYLQDAPNQDPT